MSSVRLTAFSGEQPRLIPRLLPENAAQAAHDVRLDDGGLMPIRVSAQDGEIPSTVEAPRSLYRWKTEWLAWNGLVDATPGPVADERLYYTGDGLPKMRVEPSTPPLLDIDGQPIVDTLTLNLKVPRPTVALHAATAVISTPAADAPKFTRIYVYTWVTAFGEESEPSPASNEVVWQDGLSVTLSAFQAVPAGRQITKQRIYRSQTGVQGTYYYLIAERDAAVTNYTDIIPVDQFLEPLPSLDYNQPPDALHGLIALPGGMMAAFVGKKVYFCEPYQPHAWPEKYILTVEHRIVALGAMGTSLLIMTDSHPYMANGTHPSSMSMLKVEQNLGCINERSRVDLGYAIAYAGDYGLVVARADGSIGIVTGNLFNRDGWLTYSPSTLVACQVAGRYVGFYTAQQEDLTVITGALMIDLANPVFMVHTDIRAVACFYDLLDSSLYYVPPASTAVMRMDSPHAIRRKLYWKSKEFILPAPENFGALLLESVAARSTAEQAAFDAAVAAAIAANLAIVAANPSIQGDINSVPMNVHEVDGDLLNPIPQDGMTINVGVYADKKLIASIDETNKAVRLPSGFKARTWEIDVSTNMQVYRIAMAKSMDELKVTP